MNSTDRSVEECESQVVITTHARDQFRIHHPSAGFPATRRAFMDGIPVSEEVGRAMCGRFWDPRQSHGKSYFRISEDRRGEFVGAYHYKNGNRFVVVITYLRFGLEQEAFAWEHWPPESELECEMFNTFLEHTPQYASRFLIQEPDAPQQDPGDIWNAAKAVAFQQELFSASKGVCKRFGSAFTAATHMFNNATRVEADGNGILVACDYITLRLEERDGGWRLTTSEKHIGLEDLTSATVNVNV